MKKFVLLLLLTSYASLAGQLSLTLENDFPFHDDSDYSHGTRAEYKTDSDIRFGIQQQMYTPLDLRNEDQVPGRHPYAGYLVGFIGERKHDDPLPNISLYDDVELQLGVLGPSAHADDTQRFIHKIIGSKNPAGWDHQLHDEAVVQLSYWKGADFAVFGDEYGFSGHLEGELGGLLGTLQIAPGAYADLKLGYGVSPGDTYTEIRVRSRRKPDISAYVLGGAGGWWWLRNELLDGNAHYVGNHDTLNVEKEPLTGCLRAGFGARYKNLELRLLILWGTREYKTQESAPDYVSFSIDWKF